MSAFGLCWTVSFFDKLLFLFLKKKKDSKRSKTSSKAVLSLYHYIRDLSILSIFIIVTIIILKITEIIVTCIFL
ncbi:hypothetical protein J3Q64DRAFT_1710991, partial [Phycomyces blakesleeanus]